MPSFQPLEKRDLTRLARLAREEREELFERHPEWAQRYRSALLFSILSGPAANHYVNGSSGFSDFEVVSFFTEPRGRSFPMLQRQSCRDYGPSRHGREAQAGAGFVGRQVWLFQRPLAPLPESHPLDQLQRYFQAGRSTTAVRLRVHSAIFIEPQPLLGLLGWPTLPVSPPRRGTRNSPRP